MAADLRKLQYNKHFTGEGRRSGTRTNTAMGRDRGWVYELLWTNCLWGRGQWWQERYKGMQAVHRREKGDHCVLYVYGGDGRHYSGRLHASVYPCWLMTLNFKTTGHYKGRVTRCQVECKQVSRMSPQSRGWHWANKTLFSGGPGSIPALEVTWSLLQILSFALV